MVNYTEEDLADHHAIGAVIKDEKGRILMQHHVKFNFWTIPLGKAKNGESPEEGVKTEIFEECNLHVKKLKEIAFREIVYNRNGRDVKVFTHTFEILEYTGKLENKEPHKHKEQKFIELEEIKNMPYLSDQTLMFLETLGIKRSAKI